MGEGKAGGGVRAGMNYNKADNTITSSDFIISLLKKEIDISLILFKRVIFELNF